jgi:pyruvate ferredoxin oxidoreductase alpha subunit
MEFRYQQHEAMNRSFGVIADVDKRFGEKFGRYYGGLVEEYRGEDAEAVLVGMGSVTGTARIVVDRLRERGLKVGLVKLRFYRPFPADYFKGLGRRVKAIGIIDRDLSFGYEGAVASDLKAALLGCGAAPKVINFIAGIAGRDITKENLEEMYRKLFNRVAGREEPELQFAGMRW